MMRPEDHGRETHSRRLEADSIRDWSECALGGTLGTGQERPHSGGPVEVMTHLVNGGVSSQIDRGVAESRED